MMMSEAKSSAQKSICGKPGLYDDGSQGSQRKCSRMMRHGRAPSGRWVEPDFMAAFCRPIENEPVRSQTFDDFPILELRQMAHASAIERPTGISTITFFGLRFEAARIFGGS